MRKVFLAIAAVLSGLIAGLLMTPVLLIMAFASLGSHPSGVEAFTIVAVPALLVSGLIAHFAFRNNRILAFVLVVFGVLISLLAPLIFLRLFGRFL